MGLLDDGLVIRRKATARLDDAGGDSERGTGDINLSNILKLVPGDVVAIYLAGQGISTGLSIMGLKWPALLFYLCLVVCVVLRVLVTAKTEAGVNWLLVVVTAIAFFIWAHAVAPNEGPVFAGFFGSVAGFVAMLFGVLAPALVPAEPQ